MDITPSPHRSPPSAEPPAKRLLLEGAVLASTFLFGIAAIIAGVIAAGAVVLADPRHNADTDSGEERVHLVRGQRFVLKADPGDYRLRCFFERGFSEKLSFQRDFDYRHHRPIRSDDEVVVIGSFIAPSTGGYEFQCVTPPRPYGRAWAGSDERGSPIDGVDLYIDPADSYATARRWGIIAGALAVATAAAVITLIRVRAARPRGQPA